MVSKNACRIKTGVFFALDFRGTKLKSVFCKGYK